jgi:hypothetical protein
MKRFWNVSHLLDEYPLVFLVALSISQRLRQKPCDIVAECVDLSHWIDFKRAATRFTHWLLVTYADGGETSLIRWLTQFQEERVLWVSRLDRCQRHRMPNHKHI